MIENNNGLSLGDDLDLSFSDDIAENLSNENNENKNEHTKAGGTSAIEIKKSSSSVCLSNVTEENDELEFSYDNIGMQIDTYLDYNRTKESKDVVEINKNDLEPDYLFDLFSAAQKEARINKILYAYITSTSFAEISRENVFKEEENTIVDVDSNKSLDLKNTDFDNVLELLLQNKYIKDSPENFKKIYKLKSAAALVEEGVKYYKLGAKLDDLKVYVYNLIKTYQLSIKQKIESKSILLKDLEYKASSEVVQKDNKIIELKEELSELNATNTDLSEKMKELQANEFDLSSVLNNNEFSFMSEIEIEDDVTLEELLIKFDQLLQEKNNSQVDESTTEAKIEELNHEITKLNEDLLNKNSLIGDLKKEIDSLNESIEEAKNASAETEVNSDDIYEEDETEEVEKGDDEEDEKKKTNWLKITGFIFLGFIVLIASVLGIGSIVLDDEEPQNQNANYYNKKSPTPKPLEKQEVVKEITVTPIPAPVEKVREISSLEESQKLDPIPVLNNAEHDFAVEITDEEFMNLKFDIYDSYKIRVGGKDFVKGDIINGFAFHKARSDGRLFFMKKDGSPLVFNMK